MLVLGFSLVVLAQSQFSPSEHLGAGELFILPH